MEGYDVTLMSVSVFANISSEEKNYSGSSAMPSHDWGKGVHGEGIISKS